MTPDLFDDIDRRGHDAEPPANRYREVYARQAAAKRFDAIAARGDTREPAAPPELHGERRIILNAETQGLKWWEDDRPIGWSYRLPASGRTGYLPIRHKRGPNLDLGAVHDWMRRELPGVHVDNANTRFDLHQSREDGVDLRDIAASFGDVQHDAALLDDSRQRFNLDQLSLDYLGWDVATDGLGKLPAGILHEGQFQELPWHHVAPYAQRNVEQVARLQDVFQPQLEDEDLLRVRQLERDIIPVVVEMERNGAHLDLDLLHAWQAQARSTIDAIRFKIYKDTGVELTSFDSGKQLAALCAKRGHTPTAFTPTGLPSFTDNVIAGFARVDPTFADVRTGGQLSGLLSMYLDKYDAAARADGWLRFNLHQLRGTRDGEDARGTVSGRFSGAGDKHGGFNPQQVVAVEKQLERGWCPDYVVRQLFVKGPGDDVLLASDMKQVEYRLFAHYADDPQINAAYHAAPPYQFEVNAKGEQVFLTGPDADFHAMVAKLLHVLNPGLNRKLVKNINFALIYGAALIKFCYMLGLISEAVFNELAKRLLAKDWSALEDPRLGEGKTLLDTYHRMFPRVKPLMDLAKRTARERGYVCDLMGRRARLTDRFHSALNRIIQGGAASIHKRSLVEAYKLRKQLGLRLIVTVHDELLTGLADRKMAGAVDKLLNTQYFDLKVPILWSTKTGDNWAACK